MSKRLYALTDEHVEVLKAWADYGLSISTDHKELGETADASHALIPLDIEGCVERVAVALCATGDNRRIRESYLDPDERESFREDAPAIMNAILDKED